MKTVLFLIIISSFISFKETFNSRDNNNIALPDKPNQIIYLWPPGTNGINSSIKELIKPQGKRFHSIHNPSLEIYKPKSPNGLSIILCSGGGYNYVATGVEGKPTAEILNRKGITVFVLKYRLPNTKGVNFKHPIPLSDALRAIQLVRFHADSLNLNPKMIGIMGFSAGGHLASMAGTLFNKYAFGSDKISTVSSRPDFMCLVYPVISTEKELAHSCINTLIDTLHNNPTSNDLSSELNVTKGTPPTFLVHAKDDKSVKYQNSIVMYEELKKQRIPTTLKLYKNGGHGFGIGRENTDSVNWITDFLAWLIEMKYISNPHKYDLKVDFQ